MYYENLLKMRLVKNSKKPFNSGWTNKNNLRTDITTIYGYNVGIPTGRINNLLVVDIDIKDEGEIEFNKYISMYGDIQTLKVQTPSGGYHYYFNYMTDNANDQFLIDTCLLTKTKFRGKGIDVRSNGGYVVGIPSTIDNIKYKLFNCNNNTPVINIPSTLIKFLLDTEYKIIKETNNKNIKISKENNNKNIKINETIIKINNNDIEYIINDDVLINCLNMLNIKYLNKYDEWLLITTSLKSCNKYIIWKNWSKNSSNYNSINNEQIWTQNKGEININYIINILNNDGNKISLFECYKIYKPLINNIKCKVKTINNRYILDITENNNNFTYNDFINNETLIISSDTSTAKTTATVKHIDKYNNKQNNKYKFLSIISKVSLGQQHISTFQKETGTKLASYDDTTVNFDNNKYIVCCINSILKFQYLTDEEIKDTIIFIDEVSLFTQDITHNDTLAKILKPVYILLMKLLKLAHKVIVCQASITDNVFNLLNFRHNDTMLFIKNEYKNYKGIDAHIIKDENKYYSILQNKLINNEPFFMAGDSKAEIEKYYFLLLNEATQENKEKFILITSETKFKIENASEQFNNKYVFYSPSIIYGVDFNIEHEQDVFLFLKGSTISPSESFQQITRTRKIKKVYIYSSSKQHEPKYKNIDDVKLYYNEISELNIKFNSMCINLDENNEYKIINNAFYMMFIYNKYTADIMQTNKLRHLKNILIDRGFNI